MSDLGAVVASAKIGWQILAKLPLLFGWLLRWRIPEIACKSRFMVALCGNAIRLDLRRERPMPALCGVEITMHNHLPFDCKVNFSRLEIFVDSRQVLDAVLNASLRVPASASGRLALADVQLSDQQAGWLRNLTREATRMDIALHWSASSDIRNWEQSGHFGCIAFINQ